MKRIVASLAVVLAMAGCGPVVRLSEPNGEAARLKLQRSTHLVELLAVDDSTLFVRGDGRIARVPFTSVLSVRLQNLDVPAGLKGIGALPALLVELTVMRVAFDVGQPLWGAVSGATMAATVVAFGRTGSHLRFRAPYDLETRGRLRAYCRYPVGLGPDQWRLLLEQAGQEDFESLEERQGGVPTPGGAGTSGALRPTISGRG